MARPVWNPRNPWLTRKLEALEPARDATLEVHEEEARSALTRNESPDLPFRWSLNPYRGCQHACAYCYARPTHQYLGLGAGTDFDKKIFVKKNLPELLARELARNSWKGESISFSGVTDPYQPLELRYGLTRRCLEVCARFENPVSIITKGVAIRRDLALLTTMSQQQEMRVFISIPCIDEALARALEPGAPGPGERLALLRELATGGIPCGLALAPFIPRVSEEGLGELVAGAAEAGARFAFWMLLRLPGEVQEVFSRRLKEALPERAAAILSALSGMRAGVPGEGRFGERMRGRGTHYQLVNGLISALCRRHGLGLASESGLDVLRTARRKARQGELF